MENSVMKEQEIIDKILSGETDHFRELIRAVNSSLYRVGRSYGFSHEDTQDLMQDALIECYTHLNSFESRSTFKTWAIKIMLNKCYKRSKKSAYINEIADNTLVKNHSLPLYSENITNDLSNLLMKKELNRIIEDSLMQIGVDYRMVFILRIVNDLSVAETSEVLQLSESNVKVRLNRAKVMLRKEIEKSYSKEDIFEFNLNYCEPMVNRIMSHIRHLKIN